MAQGVGGKAWLRSACLCTDDQPRSSTDDSIGWKIQFVGRHSVTCVNHVYGHSGKLREGLGTWDGIFPVTSICMISMRYIELNPVQSWIVETFSEYRRSNCAAYASGETSSVVTSHAEYLALSDNLEAR